MTSASAGNRARTAKGGGMKTLDRLGFALAHPVRAPIVGEFLSGRFLPSGELAKMARSAPSSTSEHLAILADAGLVRVFTVGRHRYYTLASDEVARGLEALGTLAELAQLLHARGDDAVVSVRGAELLQDLGVDGVLAGSIAGGCVDLTERRLHLRGPFAKALFRGMCDRGWLVRARGRELRVTPEGARELGDRLGMAEIRA
jgi:DNA-binding transcriptional ArsR family regulator